MKYKLSSLFAFIFVIAVATAFVTQQFRARQTEIASVAAIEEMGGLVVDGTLYFSSASAPTRLGIRLFRPTPPIDAITLQKHGARWDSQKLADALNGLPDLSYLAISGVEFGDNDIEKLPVLCHLKGLSLADTSITDVGLNSVARFPNIAELSLVGTNVTSQLSPILQLKALQRLDLSATRIGGEAIQTLTNGNSGIRELYLRDTEISDEAFAAIGSLARLSVLDVSCDNVVGIGFPELAGLPLERLSVRARASQHIGEFANTGIVTLEVCDGMLALSDILAISGLNGLSRLELNGVFVASADLLQLRRALSLKEVLIIGGDEDMKRAIESLGLTLLELHGM